MPQQQQQQHADYDLLAVFSDETKAEAAEAKLLKEGFTNEEVFRLASDFVKDAQFREHGPNRDRSSVFLQTTPSGPNPEGVVCRKTELRSRLGPCSRNCASLTKSEASRKTSSLVKPSLSSLASAASAFVSSLKTANRS